MDLRFSEDGPAFPSALVAALLAGDVVFLCGAGISAPQLPGFEGLVETCFAELGLEMEAAERASFGDRRFEETLGTLGRRLANPDELATVVCQALRAPPTVDLGHHLTILRLSRDLENRPVIVTTNFDTLIERALARSTDGADVRRLSHAGQDLPQPGGARFSGIVHLHGRIEDDGAGLEGTRLVLTSADYGDAYMRSGWASRFLFDLARCKNIVLVGYRAGDAPVRYILNVLEADRERFGDLKTVYALDAFPDGEDEADARWIAVAVEPLPYRAPIGATGGPDHAALWRDLDGLAGLVERPWPTRRTWATATLRKDVADLTPLERARVIWLFGSEGSAALWDIPVREIVDPSWFEVLHDSGALNADSAWVLAAWFARGFTERRRFEIAIAWCARLGQPLLEELRRRILPQRDLPPLWTRAWRLLASSEPGRRRDVFDGAYLVTQALKAPAPLHADLARAVRLLTPVLDFSDRFPRADRIATPERVTDLAALRMRVRDRSGLWELVDTLGDFDAVDQITALSTEALRATLETTRDAGMLADDYDYNDFAVPSVERHPQNEYHDGVVFLVVLLAGLLPRIAACDPAAARRCAEGWRSLPGRLGKRLWLHALRSSAYTADEAIAAVAGLPPQDFWSSSREMPLVVSERGAAAGPEARGALEDRILEEAQTYFGGIARPSGDLDWRDLARDRAVWVRLAMLRRADALSESGAEALAGLERQGRREPEDKDLFRSYMSPVQFVAGDASEIVAAKTDDRIQLAKATIEGPSLERQQDWGVFCRDDPAGALEALGTARLTVENAGLWGVLLNVVAFAPDAVALRVELAAAVFATLGDADNAFLEAVVAPLVDVFMFHPRAPADLRGWWHRLFRCALAAERRGDPLQNRCETWSLVPSGRLAQAALVDVDRLRNAGAPLRRRDLDRFATVAAATPGGFAALAALANDSAFLLTLDVRPAIDRLAEALAEDDDDGRDLRTVLVTSARITPALADAFRPQILRGVVEFSDVRDGAYGAALKIMWPTLMMTRGGPDVPNWTIGFDDASEALRKGSVSLREGAARFLADSFGKEPDKAVFWTSVVAPLLSRIWPRDRRLKDRRLTLHLVRTIVQAGEAFPDALRQLSPYLTAAAGALHPIRATDVPERWPRETLALLWLLCDRTPDSSFYELAELIDRVRAAEPGLEIDRRFQWLEQRAPRFG